VTFEVHNPRTCRACRAKANYRRRHPEVDWRRESHHEYHREVGT
jgi:hypothetical protein